MSFAAIRRLFFQLHMWTGLILGLLLALLGLSGSVLVYDDAIADFLSPPPQAAPLAGLAVALPAISVITPLTPSTRRMMAFFVSEIKMLPCESSVT